MRSSCLFFFSSRRRHTRYIGDWSSDVCSSDLSEDSASRLTKERSFLMPAVFACPCGQQFAVPPSLTAQHVRCPRCPRVLLVPATQTAPVATIVPSPSAQPAPRSRLGLQLAAGL